MRYIKGSYKRNEFKGQTLAQVMEAIKDYDYDYDEENECLSFGEAYGEMYVCYFEDGICDDSYDDSYED